MDMGYGFNFLSASNDEDDKATLLEKLEEGELLRCYFNK